MRRLLFALTALASTASTSLGEVRDTFRFPPPPPSPIALIPSVGEVGNPNNLALRQQSQTDRAYRLGEISWLGLATPRENPVAPNDFPSWGSDLSVRITHAPSGRSGDLVLGHGAFFGPEPTSFEGSSFDLAGLRVQPGDTFGFEFFEQRDDLRGNTPDAVWNAIDFQFHDLQVNELVPGTVRFDARGADTFPNGPGQRGEGYFGITYAPGAGPAILGVEIDLHSTQSGIWFDKEMINSPDGVDLETFRVSQQEGVELAGKPTFLGEESNTGNFSKLALSFAPGDFTAGDRLRFGVDTDGGLAEPAAGVDWVTLRPPATISLLLAGRDTKVSADLLEIGRPPDDPTTSMAFVDLPVLTAVAASADFDQDGDIDGKDFLAWQAGFGRSDDGTTLRSDGDSDGDGDVDRSDFSNWRAQFGTNASVTPAPLDSPRATRAVPEPPSGLLLLSVAYLAGMGFLGPRNASGCR